MFNLNLTLKANIGDKVNIQDNRKKLSVTEVGTVYNIIIVMYPDKSLKITYKVKLDKLTRYNKIIFMDGFCENIERIN